MVASELGGMQRACRSLVIPMYNEAERIGRTLDVVAASVLTDPRYEILLVDDGSTDGTADVASACVADLGLDNVRVVRSAMNRGKGAVVRAGMLAAVGESRVFADADLSAGVDDIVSCFDRVEGPGVDVVYASRAHPQSTITVTQPGHRVLTGRLFNLVLRTLRLTEELDTQCGLKGFTADAARRLFTAVTIEGFAFDVEVLALARREGMGVQEMPIAWAHADASRVRPVRDGVAMFRDVVALRRALHRAGPARPSAADPGRMSVEKFELMARLEEEHWWFRAKRELVHQELASLGVAPARTADIGCGTGGMLDVLGRTSATVLGAEFDGHAAVIASRRGAPIARSTAEALPMQSGSLDCLTSLDVVEHLDDDVVALREYARVVRPGGWVVITVPAYDWAWSRHDEILGHRRRYTGRRLRRAAESAGLEVHRCTYFHSWLTPLAVIVRKTPVGRLLGEDEEEVSYVRPVVNRLLYGVASLERRWLNRHDVPVGLSILMIARVTDGRSASR
ncbi:MAG: glycosyltransferase [Acidimicrobiales bacterium]